MKSIVLINIIGVFMFVILADGGASIRKFANDSINFVAALYQELLKEHPYSFTVCPLSIQIVFGMLNVGARGNTAKQITTVLQLPENQEEMREAFEILIKNMQSTKGYILKTANRIYIDNSITISKKYKDTTADIFQSDIHSVNFGEAKAAVDGINRWVEEKTDSKIQVLLSEEMITPNVVTVLINAIYFQGIWLHGFTLHPRKMKFFIDENKTVDVDMLTATNAFKIGIHPTIDATFLELPYAGGEIDLVIVLPTSRESISQLENNIKDVISADQWLSTVGETNNKVEIPKFQVETAFELSSVLNRLGITDAFSSSANFNGMSVNEISLTVSCVVQKTLIDVNENGTTAASATGIGIAFRTGPFSVNSPFMFYVRHKINGILYIGRYMGPEIETDYSRK